ncbi:MAG: hypothetical protein ACOX5G_03050 [Kiritimatiellia bacterium]|jgi:hypothetical protein
MSRIHTAACLFVFVGASFAFGDDAQFSERRLLLASNCVHLTENSYIPLRTELSNYTAVCTNVDNLAESRLLLATILTESSKTNDLYQAIDLCMAITQQATQEWQRALGHFGLSHAHGCAKN